MMIQMLFRAIADYGFGDAGVTVRDQKDAERWLFGDGHGLITFSTACEVAGISPYTVRRIAEEFFHDTEDRPRLRLRIRNAATRAI